MILIFVLKYKKLKVFSQKIVWSGPTAVNSKGVEVTVTKETDHTSGEYFFPGTYYMKYTAQFNGEHALPCSFIIHVSGKFMKAFDLSF